MRQRTLLACLAVAAVLALPATAHAVTNPQIPGLQVALKSRGFYAGPIDGIAGPMTASGVRRFQRHVGIVVDGVAGPITRGKLGRLGRPLFGKRHLIVSGNVGWDVSVLEFFLKRRGFWPRQRRRAFHRADEARRDALPAQPPPRGRRPRRPADARHIRRAPSGAAADPLDDAPLGQGVRALLTYWAHYYGLSPSLVKALAWQESGFQQDVRSSVGARGVMQVRRQTWSYVEMVLLGHKVQAREGREHPRRRRLPPPAPARVPFQRPARGRCVQPGPGRRPRARPLSEDAQVRRQRPHPAPPLFLEPSPDQTKRGENGISHLEGCGLLRGCPVFPPVGAVIGRSRAAL